MTAQLRNLQEQLRQASSPEKPTIIRESVELEQQMAKIGCPLQPRRRESRPPRRWVGLTIPRARLHACRASRPALPEDAEQGRANAPARGGHSDTAGVIGRGATPRQS